MHALLIMHNIVMLLTAFQAAGRHALCGMGVPCA